MISKSTKRIFCIKDSTIITNTGTSTLPVAWQSFGLPRTNDADLVDLSLQIPVKKSLFLPHE